MFFTHQGVTVSRSFAAPKALYKALFSTRISYEGHVFLCNTNQLCSTPMASFWEVVYTWTSHLIFKERITMKSLFTSQSQATLMTNIDCTTAVHKNKRQKVNIHINCREVLGNALRAVLVTPSFSFTKNV